MTVNQEGFDRRLAVVQQILQRYGLKSTQVTPIAYVEHCPFHFNNFIYKVDLAAPAVPATFANSQQPCTSPPAADGASTLVVRMSNPRAEGLNNANRVENEVAAQHLARQALAAAGLPPVVPAVYAWAPCTWPGVPDETGFGWTMGEFKSGSDLDGIFPSLSLEDARNVVEQLADILAALQRQTRLSEAAAKFGALTVDGSGAIVSGQMPLLRGGPWDTYVEVWAVKLQTQLAEADKSPLLQGWTAAGVRERIVRFIETGGVQKALGGVDVNQRLLVHGDLTMNNVLYDSETKRITALLDFDWSTTTHPCEEFLSGLWDIGGGVVHESVGQFQPMILSGDFSTQPAGLSDEDLRKWEIAKAWDAALARKGAIRPSCIAGVDGIRALKDLEDLLCPFALSNEVMLKRISDEERIKRRGETESKILDWLKSHE